MNWRDVLEGAARRQPEKTAFSFHGEDGGRSGALSYGELDLRARAIGSRLLELGLAGRPVLLLFPAGLEYVSAFFGCLYAGVIAVPAYPPTRHPRSLERVTAILRDCGADTALTTETVRDRLAPRLAKVPELAALRLVSTDSADVTAPGAWQPPVLGGDSIAFLQYTSGSTATPRGVVLDHANLLDNTALIGELFGLDEDLRGVSWLPMYHDMGLIGSVLGTVRCGGSMALTAPATFARDPFRWLKLISDERATASGGPNFAYDLCVERITEEQRAELDLSSWEVAYNGAEPLRADTLTRFADTFAASGFRRSSLMPCYGLAEASLIVTAEPLGAGFRTAPNPAGTGAALVGSGEPPAAQRLEIVDPETREPREDGEIGEVWLSGSSVARGYWNRPDATAETFGARLAGTDGPAFLRTGDLGLLRDGSLYITGRRKDLIIIRGRNHYPQDIEQTVEACDPVLKPHGGAAFSTTAGDGEEKLVLVHEVRGHDERTDLVALARRVQLAVTERHEVRPHAVVLIRQASLPRTSSGKVARHACRDAFLAGTLLELARTEDQAETAVAPAAETLDPTRVVDVLRAEVATQLGLRAEDVPADRPLIELGLDSLGAVTLQHRLEALFGLGLASEDALYASITELADGAGQTADRTAVAEDAPGDHPLSPSQRAMWFLHQLAPASAAYLISGAAEVHGNLDTTALRTALSRLTERHAALRTSFPAIGDGPVQRVHAELAPAFTELDASDWDDTEMAAQLREAAYAPLDVAEGPLLRVTVLRTGAGARLVVALHHLVADLWSVEILLRELGALYQEETGGPAAELRPVTAFPAAARWRNDELDAAHWDFWRERLAGVPAALDLPTDHARPLAQRFHGGTRRFTVTPEVSDALVDVARSAGTTLYTVLLTAYQVLLSRYTGQTDLVVGSPVHGRRDARLAGVFGSFVNTVPLRTRIDPARGFDDHLRTAAGEVQEALAHGDFPLSQLVGKLQVPRDPSRSPLVQALFTVQGSTGPRRDPMGAFAVGDPSARLDLGGLELSPLPLTGTGAQLDLQLSFARTETGLAGLLQYDADLFDEPTAARLTDHLGRLLTAIAADATQPIGSLPLLGEAERAGLLRAGNDTDLPYRRDALVHEQVAAQARKTPDAPAVTFDDSVLAFGAAVDVLSLPTLTYGELDRAANRLAHHLAGRGVGPEQVVGVHLPRSTDMAVALLAVLKAGGTYLPVDPDLPPERKRLMLEDSGASLVITHAGLADALQPLAAPVLCLDTVQVSGEPDTAPEVRLDPSNAAYVLYTSGSTGRPKGVHIQHASFVNFLTAMTALFGEAATGRVLAISRFSFDISGLDLFLPLVLGGTAHIAATSVGADGDQLRTRLETGAFSLLQATPTSWQLLFDAGWRGTPGLTMLSGAEALPPALAARLAGTGGKLWNLYGPTETTVWSAALDMAEAGGRTAPVGPPVANTRLYVLDATFEPVPPGVAGELFIGGDGLARGYLNRPELTAEKFVPDPHGDHPGARMYRTGDLVKTSADGRIEFLGRMDNQVKVNGHRVELGEIEAALGRHPVVRRAVLTVHTSASSPVLLAYVQPRNRLDVAAFDRQAANRALREALRQTLPPYMVPAHFMWLGEFPLTPSGKIDRKALPDPGNLTVGAGGQEAPATETERKLAGIVVELLDTATVGRKDNLFDLGAHSLMVSRLSMRIRETFGVQLPLHRLFESLTIERVAGLVESEHGAAVLAPVTKVDRSRYAVTSDRTGGPRSRQAARRLRQTPSA